MNVALKAFSQPARRLRRKDVAKKKPSENIRPPRQRGTGYDELLRVKGLKKILNI